MKDAQPEDVTLEQEALVRALVTTAPPPRGFGSGAVSGVADDPVQTRVREAADQWPQLARCLGPELGRRFTAWALEHPVPTGVSNPWADGLAFALREVSSSELDSDALVERQRGRARAVVRGGRRSGVPARVRPRRGPRLLVGRSRSHRRGRRRTILTLSVTPGRARACCIPGR